MSERLPHDVVVTELPGGICYRLPDRQPSVQSQASGCGPLLGGLLLMALAACLLPGTVTTLFRTGGLSEGLVVLLGSGLLVWGLSRLRTALFRLFGCHRRIEVRAGRLRVVEWLGPIWRTGSRRLDRLRRLEIGPDPTASPPHSPGSTSIPLALTAACADAPLVLAVDFPHDWLVGLAAHLRRHCEVTGGDAGAMIRGSTVEVVTLPGPGAALAGHVPPARSRSAASEQDGVLTLTVGRPNLLYADKGSLIFGLPFLAIGAVMPVYIMASGKALWWAMLPLIGIFGTVGVVFVVVALRIVSTRAVITVNGAAVVLTQSDWFFTRRRRWARGDVAGVGLGDSNLPRSKGGPAVPELQIRFAGGGHAGLFGGRDKQELEWIATVLDDALQRLPAAEPPGPDDEFAQPPQSRAVLERTPHGFRLTEPPLGWTARLRSTALVGLLLLAAGVAGGVLLYRTLPGPGAVVGAVLGAAVALLGGAFLIEAVNFANRRRLVVVSGDTLRLRPTTWWGDRERVWRREDITAIDVGPPPSSGDQALSFVQLRIHTQTGRPQRFLAYHSEEETLWVAALLRQALNVPASKE